MRELSVKKGGNTKRWPSSFYWMRAFLNTFFARGEEKDDSI